MNRAPRRLAFIALALLLALGAAVAGYRLALQRLHGALAQALGPNASVGALRVGWRGLEASEVRIRAAAHASSKRGDWPAEDELRARRIVVEPALDSLWRDGWRLRRITVEGGYVSALRRDGRIRIRFALDGRLDDPAFSLNESLATRVASGLADSLGVSLAGVVHGVGNVVKGLFGR